MSCEWHGGGKNCQQLLRGTPKRVVFLGTIVVDNPHTAVP
jgi:hypothetical protein